MIITIDSNIAEIPRLVSDLLDEPASRWCTSENQCTILQPNTVYYNTPISMSNDVGLHAMPNKMTNFIYVDFSDINTTLHRIMKNIKTYPKAVIISNADVSAFGKYHLKVGNCNNQAIAEVIAAIVDTYKYKNRLVSPEEIKHLICDEDYEPPTPLPDIMLFDLYDIMEYKRNKFPEIEDCTECRI